MQTSRPYENRTKFSSVDYRFQIRLMHVALKPAHALQASNLRPISRFIRCSPCFSIGRLALSNTYRARRKQQLREIVTRLA
jgi:hypothetical protein